MKVTEEELNRLYKDCLNVWGSKAQMRQAQEECAELIVAINHYCRNRDRGWSKMVEETADVYLMINQMMEILGRDDVMSCVHAKAERTKSRLDRHRIKQILGLEETNKREN